MTGSQDNGSGFDGCFAGSEDDTTLEITLATGLACCGSHKRLAAALNRIKPSKLSDITAINVERSICFYPMNKQITLLEFFSGPPES